ncbi:alpha-1,2-fucosyltransferase [uncultured Methanobrevibacter sp.]|uniref:alpha-1,2-fucosyltransferase n=1 Tax=uncultured Methanobrevibacter sp. TaxID=253161 RepID=UPI0032089CC3
MIIIHLTGGLGNQLFQYAFARSVSHELNSELFLDLSLFSHTEKRKHVVFGLHPFNIKGLVGYYPHVDKTDVGITQNQPQNLTKYVEGTPFPSAIYDYELLKSFEDIQLPAYFQGWYQNQIKNGENSFITENFFKINNDLIHDDLKYSLPLSYNSKILFEDMKKYDSIALHIRHGDYEDYPKFGLCTKQYYQNAINMIENELDNPKFYIFTEDHDWVDKNLKFSSPYEIIRFSEKNNTAGRGYAELLKLMSLCEHFIIANSTFSWWGAFLSENKYKIIISPKPWFQDRSILETDTIDNVKTINLKNDYSSIYESSNILLYDSEFDNAFNFNDSKFFIKNISPKNPNSEIIVKFSLKSNCFNGLRIYYKTKDESEFLEKNSLNLYYYKGETINHSLILPKEAQLDEIMIRPYTLEKEDGDYIGLDSIKIKEISS